jgi:hypothetical protein
MRVPPVAVVADGLAARFAVAPGGRGCVSVSFYKEEGMRNLRKLLLVMASVVAALAFSASTVSAQEPVEVSNETTEQHCSDFTMVNHEPVGASCTVRAVSERASILWLHTERLVEVPFSECDNVFEAAFNEDGEGYIYNQVLTPERDVCGREPCDEAATGATPHKNLAWPAEIRETAPGVLKLHVEFCLYEHSDQDEDEGTAGIPCEVLLNLEDEDPPNHAWEVGTPPITPTGDGGAPCENLGDVVELDGHWLLETNQAHPDSIEIEHLPDE